jgi:hypothetical protein
MQYRKSLLTVLSLAIVAVAGTRLNAQAHVIENQTTLIYVDANSGSDSNSGTISSPFKTIQAAINKANTYNKASVGTKVIVNPGVYRESVAIGNSSNTTSATLTVQAAATGTAIISASDVMSGWTQESTNIYSTNWTANFGACPVPSSWPMDFTPIARRREIVIVDGIPLTQTMSYADLVPGTFFVDDQNSTLFVSPSTSTNMSTAVIEVARRDKTLTVSNRSNIVLRGLVFRHAANCMNTTGAAVNSSDNILVDGIQALWNNWAGFGVFGSTNITVQNSVANYNGGLGFSATKDQNTLFTFNESDYNNWRGAQGAYYDWAMGGTKFFQMRSTTVLNHFSYNNQAEGLWFDTDNKDILVDSATLSGNVQAGLQIERNEGPVTLQNSLLCYSGQGVNVLTSEDVTIKNNTFYNNGGFGKFQGDIYLAGTAGGIAITDWQTHQTYNLVTTGMVLSGNAFHDSAVGQYVFGTYLGGTDWIDFSTTLNASSNKWYNSSTTNAFKIPNGKTVNLAGWQNAVGSDYNSTWTPVATSAVAACAAPTPSYADFSVSVDNDSYAMSSGKAVVNANVRSFGYGPVNLRVSGLPKGVGASLSQQSLTSGAVVLTISSSTSAVAQTVPVTLWATSGSRVHSVTFYVQVVPYATTQTTPTVTWPTPAGITYGTPLSGTQLNASMSVAGSCTYSPAAGAMLAAGTQTLTATCTPADTASYNVPPAATVKLSVRKAQLTITASSVTVNHGDAVPTITPSYSGFVNGDSVASLTTPPTCSTAYKPTNATGSTAVTNCSGATAANYAMTYIAGTVTVSGTKQSQTITFAEPPTPVFYGSRGIPLSASSTSGLQVTFTGTAGICVISGSSVSTVGVGTCNVTASQSGDSKYAAAQPVTRSFSVSPAQLIITAASLTVGYGDAVPAITASYSGFVNGDNSASLTAGPACNTTYTPTSPIGSTFPTSCSGAADPNYSIQYVAGTLSVNGARLTQIITFSQPPTPVTYGASAIALSASSSSGLPVSFTGTSGVCFVSGNSLDVVGAGACIVTASQAGNMNYKSAPTVSWPIVVNPAQLVVTASSPTVWFGDPIPAITAGFSGFVNGDSPVSLDSVPACSTTYTPNSAPGSSPVTMCSGAASSNYSIHYVGGTVTINTGSNPAPGSTPTPFFSLASGTYTSAQVVTISDALSGAEIYYTIDGSVPTTNSIPYTGPITVPASVTIQAVAVASGTSSATASATYTITIPSAPPSSDFTVAVSKPTLSLTAGQSGSATISVTPTNGFNSPVSFVCNGLPAGTTCSFSPATVSTSGGATSTTLTLTTSIKMGELAPIQHSRFPTAVLSVTLCLVGWKRRRIQMLMLVILSVVGMTVLSGCGATSYSIGSANAKQTTALITVSGVAGTVQHNATISLTVNTGN